ncbi:hypothetical protein TorRG33x02_331940 [Trema orientale]|uniref:Uncharacterized protein n=1 Tax=Trema orientale TaxID=63057 RepID=A0A2P5B5N4_TREOI|nr:hypothetical protein TorRG33x02_331940 [Trema orientale]
MATSAFKSIMKRTSIEDDDNSVSSNQSLDHHCSQSSKFPEISFDDLTVEFFESSRDKGRSSLCNSNVRPASGSSVPHRQGSEDHDEEWRHSVAPIPAEELIEATYAVDDEIEIALDNGIPLPLGDLDFVLEDDNNKVVGDELVDFDIEV